MNDPSAHPGPPEDSHPIRAAMLAHDDDVPDPQGLRVPGPGRRASPRRRTWTAVLAVAAAVVAVGAVIGVATSSRTAKVVGPGPSTPSVGLSTPSVGLSTPLAGRSTPSAEPSSSDRASTGGPASATSAGPALDPDLFSGVYEGLPWAYTRDVTSGTGRMSINGVFVDYPSSSRIDGFAPCLADRRGWVVLGIRAPSSTQGDCPGVSSGDEPVVAITRTVWIAGYRLPQGGSSRSLVIDGIDASIRSIGNVRIVTVPSRGVTVVVVAREPDLGVLLASMAVGDVPPPSPLTDGTGLACGEIPRPLSTIGLSVDLAGYRPYSSPTEVTVTNRSGRNRTVVRPDLALVDEQGRIISGQLISAVLYTPITIPPGRSSEMPTEGEPFLSCAAPMFVPPYSSLADRRAVLVFASPSRDILYASEPFILPATTSETAPVILDPAASTGPGDSIPGPGDSTTTSSSTATFPTTAWSTTQGVSSRLVRSAPTASSRVGSRGPVSASMSNR